MENRKTNLHQDLPNPQKNDRDFSEEFLAREITLQPHLNHLARTVLRHLLKPRIDQTVDLSILAPRSRRNMSIHPEKRHLYLKTTRMYSRRSPHPSFGGGRSPSQRLRPLFLSLRCHLLLSCNLTRKSSPR